MGKTTGFLDYKRKLSNDIPPKKRIKNYNSFHQSLSKKDRQIQASRCMDCGVPFCQYGDIINNMTSGCPLHNLIPEFNEMVYQDNYKQAFYRLIKNNNFPEFTSRVCPAPCQASCTCGLNDESVTIKENELGIIDYAYQSNLMKVMVPTIENNKSVAIIGSGPSGLAAADELNKRGYKVTVYEKDDRVGGLLMYGIPNMKLEKEIVLKRVEILKKEGINFVTNYNVDSSKKADEIIKQNDSVILCSGSQVPRDINVKGRGGLDIYFAMDYLTQTTKHLLDGTSLTIDVKDKKVIVVGGGDTGNDCIATAIRQGCKDVVQLEMMSELGETRDKNNPWPQWPKVKKTDYGQQECIEVFNKDPRVYNTTIKEFILQKNNRLKQVKLVSVDFKDGKLKEIEGSERIIDADIVIIAAGFVGTNNSLIKNFNISLSPKGNVEEASPYKTIRDNIYVAGDSRRGQSLVVWAIKEGREVAKIVHQDLSNQPDFIVKKVSEIL